MWTEVIVWVKVWDIMIASNVRLMGSPQYWMADTWPMTPNMSLTWCITAPCYHRDEWFISPLHTSVCAQIVTRDWSISSDNISEPEILRKVTYIFWVKHIDPFHPSFSCVPNSCRFQLQWPSSSHVHPVSLTTVFAELIQEQFVWRSWPHAGAWLDHCWHSQALYRICCLPPRYIRSQLDCARNHSRYANYPCRKCFQVHDSCHIVLEICRLLGCARHLVLESVLQGGLL